MSNMEDNKPTEDQLLEQAVQEALATPAPLPKEEKKKPYLYQQISFDLRHATKKKFKTGSKKKEPMDFKKDTDGNPVTHGNGGAVYLAGTVAKDETKV